MGLLNCSVLHDGEVILPCQSTRCSCTWSSAFLGDMKPANLTSVSETLGFEECRSTPEAVWLFLGHSVDVKMIVTFEEFSSAGAVFGMCPGSQSDVKDRWPRGEVGIQMNWLWFLWSVLPLCLKLLDLCGRRSLLSSEGRLAFECAADPDVELVVTAASHALV